MALRKTTSDATNYFDAGPAPVIGSGARTVYWKFRDASGASDSYHWGWGENAVASAFRARLNSEAFYTVGTIRFEVVGGFSILAGGSRAGNSNWITVAASMPSGGSVDDIIYSVDGATTGTSHVQDQTINTGSGNLGFFAKNLSTSVTAGGNTSLAEFAVWDRALTQEEMNILTGSAITPLAMPNGLIRYFPLYRKSDPGCLVSGNALTENGSGITVEPHPRVIRRSAEVTSFPSTSAPDTTAPTVNSVSVPSAGDEITVQMSEDVTTGSGGSGGWTCSLSGVTVTAAVDGVDASIVRLTPSRTIEQGESLTVGYTQPTDGFEDLAGNDLVTFSGQAVTNNSTYDPPEFLQGSVSVNGLNLFVTFTEDIALGSASATDFSINVSGRTLSNLTRLGAPNTAVARLDVSPAITDADGAVVLISYNQTGSGIEDLSGDLAPSFSNKSLTNNSTVPGVSSTSDTAIALSLTDDIAKPLAP